MFANKAALGIGGIALVLTAFVSSAALALDPPAKSDPPAAAPAEQAAAPAADGPLTTNSGVYTDAQADRGKALYSDNCALCHGNELRGSPGGPGIAGGAFVKSWTSASIGDLYTFITTNMPPGRVGSLPNEQYVAVLAYIMRTNGWPAGETDLPADADALSKIVIEAAPKKK